MESSSPKPQWQNYFHLALFLLGPILWLVLFSVVNTSLPLIYVLILQAAMSGIFLYLRPKLFIPSLFFVFLLGTTYLPLPETLWVIRILIAVGVLSLFIWIIPSLRKITPQFKLGGFDKRAMIYCILIVIVSTSALFIWKALAKPDIAGFINTVLDLDPTLIIPAMFVFPIFNAIAEELMFRWMLWGGLNELISSSAAIIIIQGMIFGLAHYVGFPNGWLGVAMAGSYGLMLGFVRHHSRGLLAPTIAHTFADLTIIIIVFKSAGII